MQPKLFLRIAAALMAWHTIGHSFGALGHSIPPNPRLAAVITGMQTEHFDFMGRSASLGLFFSGYGITMIFVLLLITIQLWMLSAKPNKPILFSLGLFLAAQAVTEYIYFFPMAAIVSLLASLLALMAAGTITIKTPKTEITPDRQKSANPTLP
jgi:hypothetical protein